MLRTASIAGLELKQEAVAQGAELQVGFHLWAKRGDGYAEVYDEDVVGVSKGQEYLAVTSDDHAWPPSGRAPGHQTNPATGGWSLALPPWLWAELSHHLLDDGGEHAAVILADQVRGPRGPRLLGRAFIPAVDGLDYVEGSAGYRSLSPEFVRDAMVRARDERLGYLAVHNHHGATAAGFSQIELASHERGYPALRRITGQLVGALVVTPEAAVGDLWLPGGAREALTEVVVPGSRIVRLGAQPQPPLPRNAVAGLQVGVVGLGGIALRMAELLSGFGVSQLVLIDRHADEATDRALTLCDWIFLATEDPVARRQVNEIVHCCLIPATLVESAISICSDGGIGGIRAGTRVLVPGEDCLRCDGLDLYGVAPTPSVDALDMLAATTAVNEFVLAVTGLVGDQGRPDRRRKSGCSTCAPRGLPGVPADRAAAV